LIVRALLVTVLEVVLTAVRLAILPVDSKAIQMASFAAVIERGYHYR
jgi:hypothetical protein